jgi:FMN reductase
MTMTEPFADLVVLVGNPRAGSRTRALADAAARALAAEPDLADAKLRGTEVLELAEIVGITFGPEPAVGAERETDPFEVVRSARLLLVATPTYKGTYTGLLKVFLDRFGPDALAGVVAVPVAVAASDPHLAAVQTALRDVLRELGASVPAPALALLERELTDPTVPATEWVRRHADALAAELGRRAR